MKKYPYLVLAVMLMASCYRPTAGESFQDLKVLIGTWNARSGVQFNEQWTYANDSLLLGLGFSMKEADTVFKEQLRIILKQDSLYYGALVDHNKEFVYFKLSKATRHEWVFENSQHDYPNVIRYLVSKDSLLQVATTNMRGNKKIEFNMVRRP